MKLTINKLIANDIINYGMDKTTSFNYAVSLNSYLNEYDEESQKYIKNNLEEIIEDIEKSEPVADLEIERTNDDIEFNIVYYWEYLLTEVEKLICDMAQKNNIELDFEEIRDIGNVVLDDDFKVILIDYIKKYEKDQEYDI